MTAMLGIGHRKAIGFYGASREQEPPPPFTTGQILQRESQPLRWAASHAYRNDPLITNAVSILTQGLIANPLPVSDDKEATASFAKWASECGYKHSYGSYAAVQRMVAHHLVQDGECFVQRVWSTSKYSENGLTLAVWPKRFVDRSKGHNFTGHEYDGGMWSGTWFESHEVEPDFSTFGSHGLGPVFVPRDDLVWVRYAIEGDQVDGMPHFHASIEAALQLSDLAATSITSDRVSACLAAVAIAKDSGFRPHLGVGPRIRDADGNEFREMQPGTFAIAEGIDDIKTVQPNRSASTFSVADHENRVAAGTGLPRELISSMGDASFSAMRHAMLRRNELTKDIAIDFDNFRLRSVGWFVEAEAMLGRDYEGVTWEWLERPMQSVDPVKTATANKIDIEIGIKSKRRAIAESGLDPDVVLAEVAAEQEDSGQE